MPPIDSSVNHEELTDIQDILNHILPPKRWEKDGKYWNQTVSSVPATRLDVITLHEEVESLIRDRNAKPFGICPIRRDIFNQYFDELLRQVTVNCAERGLLLMRVRDELTMSLATYRGLYESAIAFGLRKSMDAEKRGSEADTRCVLLEEDNVELRKQVRALQSEMDDSRRVFQEEKDGIEERYKDGNEKLKLANHQLKVRLRLVRSSIEQNSTTPSMVQLKDAELNMLAPSTMSLTTSCDGTHSTTSVVICVFLEVLVPCAIVMLAVTLCILVLLSKLGN